MLPRIPKFLGAETLHTMRAALETAPRVDGKLVAGFQSALAKTNLQLPETDPVVLPEDEEELKSLFSQITFGHVPDAGHMIREIPPQASSKPRGVS